MYTSTVSLQVPFIKQAQASRNNKALYLFGSSWTAPIWMKNNKVWHGGSMILPEYYQAWANYHVKALDAYKSQGIDFWGLTVANEPLSGWLKWAQAPSMGWTTDAQVCNHILLIIL